MNTYKLSYKRKIVEILELLNSKDLIRDLRCFPSFNDDPKVFLYLLQLKNLHKYSDGKKIYPNSSGFSLKSTELALFKCLMEGMERYCSTAFREKDGVSASYKELKSKAIEALDPFEMTGEIKMRDEKFLWMKGMNFISGAEALIPVQLIYYNYDIGDESPLISEQNSNGCAGGLAHDFAITRAIYEAVERDAFFSIYLNKITPFKVNTAKLKNKQAMIIEKYCERYNLELLLLDITNDLDIPVFLTLLIDRTGLGPALTAGLKSHLDPEDAILGSINEVFNTRATYRHVLPSSNRKTKIPPYNEVNTMLVRNLFWSSPQTLSRIDFLTKSPDSTRKYTKLKLTSEQQIVQLKSIFKGMNYDVYDFDLSHSLFKPLGVVVHKIIIPQLQTLYTREAKKSLNIKRLEKVASYFGIKTETYNEVPHFFL